MAELNSLSLKNDANLVAYWRMEGNSNDSKGSANGTDTAITYSLANGKYGQGAGFNGSSSKIVFTNKIIPMGAKTISFWLKTSNVNYQDLLTNGRWDIDGVYGTSAIINNTGKALFILRSNTNTTSISTTINVADGVLRMISFTWDGTTNANAAKVYINGILDKQGTYSITETTTPTNNLRMGSNIGDIYYLNGSLDDVSIFSRALTTDEVLTLYREQSSSGFFALLGGL